MKVSSSVDVAAAAFRVYLVYTLRETEDLLAESKFRVEIDSSGLTSRLARSTLWKDAANAAATVISFIGNCQHDDEMYGFFARGWHGLCAIEAAQDELHRSLAHARDNAGTSSYRIERASAAKLVSNSIFALNMKDRELSDLWIQAALFVRREPTNMNRIGAEYLSNASAIEIDATHSNVPEVNELRNLTARQFRRAAASSVMIKSMTRYHESSVASAEAYKLALELCVESQDTTEESAPLWSRAIATMRDAAELIITKELGKSVLGHAVSRANALASDARCASKIVEKIKIDQSAVENALREMSATTNPKMAAMWRTIRTELEKNCELRERSLAFLIKGENRSTAAVELTKVIEASVVLVTAQSAHNFMANAAYYKKKAALSCNTPFPQLRGLIRQCWTLAATHMENAVQAYCDSFADGEFALSPEVQKTQRLRIDAANRAVHTAESLLQRVASHLGAARGAEAAGCDPREAEYWHSAADCLLKAAQDTCAALQEHVTSLSHEVISGENVHRKTLDEEKTLVTMADYLQRARLLRTAVSVKHGARIASLYELAVDLVPLNDVTYRTSIPMEFVLKYISDLSLRDLSKEETILREKGCEYAREYGKTSGNNNLQARSYWNDAVSSVREAVQAIVDNLKSKANMCSAHAAVVALAAQACVENKKERAIVCDFAAQELYNQPSGSLAMYKVALAARLISLGSNNKIKHPVPPELLRIQDEEIVNGFQEAIHSHARAFRLRAMCQRRSTAQELSHVERDAWKAAAQQATSLTTLYTTKSLFGTPQSNLASLLHAQEVAMVCYVGAASSVRDPEASTAWEIAVAHCRATALVSTSNTKKRMNLVAATELLISAAEAKQNK